MTNPPTIQPPADAASVSAAPVAFLDRTWGEALALAEEARDYIAAQGEGERGAAGLHYALETTRITACVGQIIAWLMMQRAVLAGEMSREEALAPANRIAGHDACLREPAPWLPPRLADLSDRARRLYVRVARLDELAARA